MLTLKPATANVQRFLICGVLYFTIYDASLVFSLVGIQFLEMKIIYEMYSALPQNKVSKNINAEF